ncbi:FAD-dependent monooxygenase [Kutzneria albida]|uniref:FAD-dependent oxidoreductase n=1 Tax=Kutzneria albida DSM 43870 TaxID=1449976 RepID=W5W7B4_9PSEU|nr:FAD-dependent monooxygenase [Kutzneria albida]AHH96802.1 FAD-dependent oxidoreductase [Kutzneria albida DSM 43870]
MSSVVVVGGGPVGLMLACELALNHVRPIVLERLTEIDRRPKAGAVTGRGAELLDRRGLTPPDAGAWPFTPRPVHPDSLLAKGKPGAGHFAGMFVLTGGPGTVMIPQQQLEADLAACAVELGVDLRRGHTLVDLDTVQGPDGRYELDADWIVGCDGGRSSVRKLAGFGFPGTDGISTGYQAVVELDDPEFHPHGWFRKEHGLLVHGPMPGRVMTLEFDGPPLHRDSEITREELQRSLRRLSGTQVQVTEVRAVTRFTDNARQADSYRRGRVLLAGDAAHVHSPWGGPGLRLGLCDAVNLGWKLAAVARGLAGADLLDTYTVERHPVAARALELQRASVALLSPGPHVSALRDVVSGLLDHEDANRWLTAAMGDLDLGPFCPDLSLDGGPRVGELQRTGRGLLLDLADDPGLRAVAEGWSDRVEVVTGRCEQVSDRALLVRPDGQIAWRSGDAEPLREQLTRWFGISHS